MIEAIALGEGGGEKTEEKDVNTVIENLKNELDEISEQINETVDAAKIYLAQRVVNREEDSTSVNLNVEDDTAPVGHHESNPVEQSRREVEDSDLRLERLGREQEQQEDDHRKSATALEFARQRTEEPRARKVVELNAVKARSAENETTKPVCTGERVAPIKLKVVSLPVFSGDDKTEYESWKAAFMSVVDDAQVTTKEKMLWLLSSLSGRALRMVKDLGYSENAYARAKAKLENKFGGERRIQVKHLTTVRAWRKLRPGNLEDMEEFLAVLDRVLVSLQDCALGGELNGQSLNLTAKEKLSEEDVQAYKYWCFEREEDNFE